ncbi:MAG: DUF4388 domain-containing protein [Acidobacteriota bacterium]
MARILVVEPDAMLAAALEDRFHAQGHRVQRVGTGEQAIDRAISDSLDLVLLAADLPLSPGVEVIRQLRTQPETRTLPVLMIGPADGDRLGALRAGAEEYLVRPVDFEELDLRVERLVGRGDGGGGLLQGDLQNHPLWEVLQHLQQTDKTGTLTVRGRDGVGRATVRRGAIRAARFEALEDEEAVLALLTLDSGRFHFDDATAPSGADGPPMATQQLLLRAAWLKDQLRVYRAHVPETGRPLRLARAELPAVDDEFAALPLARIVERVQGDDGLRLFDLIHDGHEAPARVRLAVAWLIAHHVLVPVQEAPTVMTTGELSSSMVIDFTVSSLLMSAGQLGFEAGATVPYLVLAENGAQPALRAAIGSAAPKQHGEQDPIARMLDQLELQGAGSVTLGSEGGRLSLSVQALKDPPRPALLAILPSVAGLVLWLDRGTQRPAARTVLQRLGKAPRIDVTLVASSDEARAVAEDLAAGVERFRVTRHAPKTLVGLLRLLHP